MAGGPVTGSGLYGKSAVTKPASIIIPTMLQIANDAVDYWLHITCLYDKYWYDRPDTITLPISFFMVTGISETQTNEVSKKRVMLYEPQKNPTAETLANPVREGVMNTIVDNIVGQPKTYSLEIIVPDQPFSGYISRGVGETLDMIGAFIDIFGGDSAIFEDIFAVVKLILKVAQIASDIATKFPSVADAAYINKNSLEVMAKTPRVLTMKMWTGYQYKFVTITGLTFQKRGTEDNVHRATLQVQEMPVLTVNRNEYDPTMGKRNWAATAIRAMQGTLASPFLHLTRVKSASDASGDQVDWVGGM